MDERAKIPVTLPRDYPTQSYWQDPPDDIADLRTTPHLPGRTDILIVGSGISGAAAAWDLLQHGDGSSSDGGDGPPSVVMLEARQACSGATGRNGSSAPPSWLGPGRLTADLLPNLQAATQRRPATGPSWRTPPPWASRPRRR